MAVVPLSSAFGIRPGNAEDADRENLRIYTYFPGALILNVFVAVAYSFSRQVSSGVSPVITPASGRV
jgi:hypothetical protein